MSNSEDQFEDSILFCFSPGSHVRLLLSESSQFLTVHCIQLDTKRKWHRNILFFWIIWHSQQMLMSFLCPPWAIRLFSHYLSYQRCLECSFGCHWPTTKKRPWYAVASKIDSPSNIFVFSPLTTAMRTLMPGQWLAGLTWEARLSAPSSRLPMCHLFNTIENVFFCSGATSRSHPALIDMLSQTLFLPGQICLPQARTTFELKSNSPSNTVCPTWPRLQQGRQILQQSLLSLQL